MAQESTFPMKFTIAATLAVTGLLFAGGMPALSHDLHPELSIGSTDRTENTGVHQFDWPTDSPVALPVRSSAKALETIGGVDFRTAIGAPIYAVADGVVISAGPSGVVVHHGKNLRSTYTHIRQVQVTPGQKVVRRDLLGSVVAPRGWEKAHFHFAVNEGARLVDPMDFLPAVDPNAE